MDQEITLDPKKLDVIPIDSVRPNPWNPKDKDTKEFEEVKASIKANGLRGYIVVRTNSGQNPEVDKYEIIDGEQRWRACKELNFQKVIVYNEGIVDDKRAKELTLWWDVHVEKNELSYAKLIASMIEQYGTIKTSLDEKKIVEMQELAKFNFDDYKKNATTPPPPIGELLKTFMIQLTNSQYDIVQQALEKAKKASGTDITDSKALEFVCAEYINAPKGTVN